MIDRQRRLLKMLRHRPCQQRLPIADKKPIFIGYSDQPRASVISSIQISEDILPLGQFKTHAAQLLKRINNSNRSIVITQNGKPTAVVLSPGEFDRLNAQAQFIAAVQQGLNDDRAGRVIADSELDAILERELTIA